MAAAAKTMDLQPLATAFGWGEDELYSKIRAFGRNPKFAQTYGFPPTSERSLVNRSGFAYPSGQDKTRTFLHRFLQCLVDEGITAEQRSVVDHLSSELEGLGLLRASSIKVATGPKTFDHALEFCRSQKVNHALSPQAESDRLLYSGPYVLVTKELDMRVDLFNEQLIYIPSSADQVVRAYITDRGLMFGSAEFFGSRIILNLLSVDTQQPERRITASFLLDQMRQDDFIKGEISMICGMPQRYITSKCIIWRISEDDRWYDRLVEASDENGSKSNAVFASQVHGSDPLSETYKLADVGEHLNETDIRQPTQEWLKHRSSSALLTSMTQQHERNRNPNN